MPIATVVQTGFEASSNYDAHRPPYPQEAIEKFLEVLEVKDKASSKILDLGAGTGKFTEVLVSRPEKYRITAVEPHDAMLRQLQAKNLRDVVIQQGAAEDLQDMAEGEFDAVVVAQAFHWMSNMDALKQIHRVLRPTGVLGLIWNIEDFNSPKEWQIHDGWESTMRDVMWSLEDGYPRFRDGKWKSVFDQQGSGNPLSLHSSDPIFGLPIGEETFDYVRSLSKDDVWKTFMTYSPVANLSQERLSQTEATFWKAIDAADTEVDAEGKVAVHGKTVIAWTSSIPDVPIKSGG